MLYLDKAINIYKINVEVYLYTPKNLTKSYVPLPMFNDYAIVLWCESNTKSRILIFISDAVVYPSKSPLF